MRTTHSLRADSLDPFHGTKRLASLCPRGLPTLGPLTTASDAALRPSRHFELRVPLRTVPPTPHRHAHLTVRAVPLEAPRSGPLFLPRRGEGSDRLAGLRPLRSLLRLALRTAVMALRRAL